MKFVVICFVVVVILVFGFVVFVAMLVETVVVVMLVLKKVQQNIDHLSFWCVWLVICDSHD